MRLRMFLSAFFKMSNLGWLFLFLSITALGSNLFEGTSVLGLTLNAQNPILYLPAIFLYLGFVGKTLFSKDFHTRFNQKERIRKLQDLNYTCLKLANEAKRKVGSGHLQRLRKVMEDKSEIVNSFFKGEKSFLKERIAEQTLNLVIAYIKLLMNYCLRSRELSGTDVNKVTERMNTNSRKLNFVKDVHMAEDIKNLINMDEKILLRLKEEKKDLERTSAKLDYMESTVNMFRHQILSNIESDEMLEKLDTAVNEATALDSVLEDRRRNKMKM